MGQHDERVGEKVQTTETTMTETTMTETVTTTKMVTLKFTVNDDNDEVNERQQLTNQPA